jgi:hypothetical protein
LSGLSFGIGHRSFRLSFASSFASSLPCLKFGLFVICIRSVPCPWATKGGLQGWRSRRRTSRVVSLCRSLRLRRRFQRGFRLADRVNVRVDFRGTTGTNRSINDLMKNILQTHRLPFLDA